VYKVYRSKKITETLALCDAGGDIKAELLIDIDYSNKSKEIEVFYKNFIGAQQSTVDLEKALGGDNNEEKLQSYLAASKKTGDYAIAFFNVLFGEDNTSKILEFYADRYEEMFNEILPFVFEVIIPQISAYNARKREEIKKQYKHKIK